MLSVEDKKDIAELVDIILTGLKKNHLLKNPTNSIYDDVSHRLYEFYKNGEVDPKIKAALQDFKDDLYFNILPLYYKNKYTIENIAEIIDVDVSTIVRNKKRLCLSIYLNIE